ncbi:hypothetical protein A2U01_0117127, partial [Trifolium medium]|nr:hypothetical protein [Trifolium medium]
SYQFLHFCGMCEAFEFRVFPVESPYVGHCCDWQ